METGRGRMEFASEPNRAGGGFREYGYCVLRELLDPTELFAHMQSLLRKGGGTPDAFVRGSVSFYKDERFERVLRELVNVVEGHCGCKVFETYSFARRYDYGHRLVAHRDRPSCEISLSLCLGNQGNPWPLWVLDRTGTPRALELRPGDAVLYRGLEIMHWRQPNTSGPSSHVFLHYVDQNGPYAIHRKDRYKPFKLSLPIFRRVFNFEIRPAYRRRRVNQD